MSTMPLKNLGVRHVANRHKNSGAFHRAFGVGLDAFFSRMPDVTLSCFKSRTSVTTESQIGLILG